MKTAHFDCMPVSSNQLLCVIFMHVGLTNWKAQSPAYITEAKLAVNNVLNAVSHSQFYVMCNLFDTSDNAVFIHTKITDLDKNMADNNKEYGRPLQTYVQYPLQCRNWNTVFIL